MAARAADAAAPEAADGAVVTKPTGEKSPAASGASPASGGASPSSAPAAASSGSASASPASGAPCCESAPAAETPSSPTLPKRTSKPTAKLSASLPSPQKAKQSPAKPSPAKASPSTTTLPALLGHRCVHCGATETPLWRAGPGGPKTLCNACGVRWKKTGSVVARARRGAAGGSRGGGGISKPRATRAPASAATAAPRVPLSLPAPVAVRVHEQRAGNPVYESVFAGLMVVPRGGRSRTRTTRAQLFFDGVSGRATAVASPPPDKRAGGSVYVTETVAPSPSPSPPPIPRMEPLPEGRGFRMVMTVKRAPEGGKGV